MLNPMAQAMQDARYATITHETKTIHDVFGGNLYSLIPHISVVIVFFLGIIYFRKESKYFAENI
jgi:ABC-2 type transport system permease protein